MKRILLLNEMMVNDSTSYNVRFDTAKYLSYKYKVLMISPTDNRKFLYHTNSHKSNFNEVISAGILPNKFRRGGFSFIDMITKIFFILLFKPHIILTTTGHRPSQLVPALIGKLLFNSCLIDERWEFYGTGGRSDERKGFVGKTVVLYDRLLELSTIRFFDKCIAVSKFLKEQLKSDKVIFYPGVIDFSRYSKYNKKEARKELKIPTNYKLIGLLSLGDLDHNDYILFFNEISNLILQDKDIFIFCTGEKKYITEEILTRFQDRVIYKGWLPENSLYKHLSACDMFLLPLNASKRNLGRWPIKFNEFVYFDRPILTSSNHDISDFFGKTSKILKYNSFDEKEIRNKLLLGLQNKLHYDNYVQTQVRKLDVKAKIIFLETLFK